MNVLKLAKKVLPSKKQPGPRPFPISNSGEEWQPEPFLLCNQDGKMQITTQAADILSSLKKPVAVVAIAGLYRTGKSLLLNRLAGKQSGFPLGATVQAQTKGIWLWVIPHPLSQENRYLILLDTEGLADPESGGGSTYDAWIFSMAILLSSLFVYNSVGTIDDRAIDNLHLVTELTEKIRIKSGGQDESGDDFDSFLPPFIWVLRDFVLELMLDGKPCTEDEYLESTLKIKPGAGKRANNHNLPRRALKEFFPERKCFTMVRPVDDESKLRNMDKLKEKDLKPQFIKALNLFCQYVFDTVPDKTIYKMKLNGPKLLEITKSYVEAINNGVVPCIDNAFKTMSDKENSRAFEESNGLYGEQMSYNLSSKLPVSSEELSNAHREAEKNALTTFLSIVVEDENNSLTKQLQKHLAEEREVWAKRNEKKSTEICRQVIEDLYKSIRTKVQRGEYAGNGGYKKYEDDREVHLQNYERTPNKGVSEANVLSAFNKEHEDEAQAILAGDRALSQMEREREEENRLAKEQELSKNAELEKREEERKRQSDQLRSIKYFMVELSKIQAQGMGIDKKEFERKLKKLIEEEEELRRVGLKEEADLKIELMDALKIAWDTSERARQEREHKNDKDLERVDKKIEELDSKRAADQGGFFRSIGASAGAAIDWVFGW